jgi:hypothetical protein
LLLPPIRRLLYEKLRKLSTSYQSEDDLRAASFSKPPDVKLDAPVGVRGPMVNWIDSKVSVGNEHIHKAHASDQFQRYFFPFQILLIFSSFLLLLSCSYNLWFCRITIMISVHGVITSRKTYPLHSTPVQLGGDWVATARAFSAVQNDVYTTGVMMQSQRNSPSPFGAA